MKLKGKQLAVIGGDKRYIQVINHLAEQHAMIYIEGFSTIDFPQENIQHTSLDEIPFETLDGIILPVLGMDNNEQIQLNYPAGKAQFSDELIRKTPGDCVIYTGTASERLKAIAKENDRELIILFARDDIAIANSIPTAEATLQIAMEKIDYTIHNSNVLVTGFGRVGITVARLFANTGAEVTVAARNHADFARIKEMRLTPVSISQLTETIPHIDICINTVPHLIITKKVIHAMNENSLIIDLASHPGGTDFSAADGRGIQAIHALGLPGKVAPKTAGDIIAHTITQLIIEKNYI